MIVVSGRPGCKATQKALRFFKERGIKVQFLDIEERGLSKGEVETMVRLAGSPNSLLDRDSAAYQKRGLAYMEYDIKDELLRDPLLLRTPFVRLGTKGSVGPDEAAWKSFAGLEKGF